MSEDSFITNYNERNSFQGSHLSIANLYENFQKFQTEIINLRKQNVELEGQIVEQRSLKLAMERKYQRALQDIEHYKIKPLIDRNINDLDDDSMEMDYENMFIVNEKNSKKNIIIELKNNDLEQKCEELEKKNFDLEEVCENLKVKCEYLEKAYEDLKSFVEEKKNELSTMNKLKLQITEMEQLLNANDKIESNIFSTFNKIDELQVKCFKLENENKKYRENHTNLLLLVEENTSLTKQIGFLEDRLSNCDHDHSFSHLNDSSSEIYDDKWSSRKFRHLERENEILKAQHVEISEKNVDLVMKMNSMSEKITTLKQNNADLNDLISQRQTQIGMMENERIAYSKEVNSYKNVLCQFSEQSSTSDTTIVQMITSLRELCDLVDSRKSLLVEQTTILEQLTLTAMYRLEQRNSDNPEIKLTSDDISADQKMILELRKHLEQLSEQLDDQNKLIRNFKKVEETYVDHHYESMDLQFQHYSEMGFCKDNDATSENEKNRKIFRKLTTNLLDTIRRVIGYSLEIGPNGYLSVKSCLDDDPSHVLEFKIGEDTVLIENSYFQELKHKIDSNDCFPVLLARITLDLIEQKNNVL